VAFLLRKIEKHRWNKEVANKSAGLPLGECPADTLVFDLKTEKNTLSFWHIEDDYSNLNLVVVAIACTRESLDTLDYGLVSVAAIDKIGIKIEPNPNDTVYNIVNTWHRDLVKLTASNLASLAQTMWNQIEPQRVSDKAILEYIVSGVASGELDRAKIKIKSDRLIQRLNAL
jgi:hypothetical protein